MQRIEAYTPEDGMEPVWSTILPSGNSFDSIESVLDGEAIFLQATELSILLNARDGSVAWQTTESGADGSSDRCSTVGTTGHALIRGCGSFSTTRVVAVEIAE
jgi:hypothetical protein